MKKYGGIVLILVFLSIVIFVVINKSGIIGKKAFNDNGSGISSEEVAESDMKLTSSAFEDGKDIPSKYTCSGENVNPSLEIEGVPENAQSLVLVVDDPDAPGGSFTHWLVWNIDPKLTKIVENSVPDGAIQGKNDFGKNQYGGPCPPSGTHRYQFKLYALDTSLNLDTSSKKKDLEAAVKNHILSQSLLVGLYKRQ